MFTKPEFHYSEDECCFVPKKNTFKVYSIKFLGVILLTVSLSVTMITIYGQEIFLDEKEKQMVSEISELKERLQVMNVQFKELTESDDLLRSEVNLPLLDLEEKELGIGGSRESVSNLDVSDPEAILKASEKMVGQLAKKIEMQRTSYMEIMRQYETNEKLFNCMPAIRPCNGHVTSDFGMRIHPIFKVRRFHAGMDFSARIGTPIHVTGDGVVELVARNGGFGKMVRVNHGFGYKTIYAHLSEFKVKKGDRVKRGDVIALSGNTGISEGPHLHYEVIKNGIKMQPRNFIFDDFGPREYIAAAKVSGL
jgi:murein DD-endopeptidase MepM/ murein hydrolase activator NlpD